MEGKRKKINKRVVAGVPPLHNLRQSWASPLEPGLIECIRDALVNDHGVLLQGDVGAGRKQVAQQVLKVLDGKIHVEEFSSLVLKRSPSAEDHQAVALALRRRLQHESNGLPVTIYLGSSHILNDEWSAILRSLGTYGGISVLAISYSTTGSSNQSITGVNYLERIRIWPLSIDASEDWIRGILGGPVSHAAVLQLWVSAAGKRHFLEVLLLDWTQSGYLRAGDDGTWIVTGQTAPPGVHTVELWNRIYRSLPRGQQKVIDVVALSGRIPLNNLLKVISAKDLDDLVEKGILNRDSGIQHTIQFKVPAAETAALSQIMPEKAKTLLSALHDQVGSSSGVTLDRIYDWERRCGFEISETQILAEARKTTLAGNSVRALALLSGAHGLATTPLYLSLRLRSLIQQGHKSTAHVEVNNLSLTKWLIDEQSGTLDWSALPEPEDKADEISLILELIKYFVYFEGLPLAKLDEWVDRVRGLINYLYEESFLKDDMFFSLLAQTDLLLAQLSLLFGRISWTGTQHYFHPGLTGNQLRDWQTVLDYVGILRGEVVEHLDRCNEMALMRNQSDAAELLKKESLLKLFELRIVAGEWRASEEILMGSWVGGEPASTLIPESRLYAGLLDALMGRYKEAALTLAAERSQLKSHDPLFLSTLVMAAAAYSNAALGNLATAKEALVAQENIRPKAFHIINKLEILFLAYALHDTESHLESLTLLRGEIEDARANGDIAWALLMASSAVSLGHNEYLRDLGELSNDINGRFADACGRLVEGARSHRSDIVLLAANALMDLGHHRLSEWGLELATQLNDGCHEDSCAMPHKKWRVLGEVRPDIVSLISDAERNKLPRVDDRTNFLRMRQYAEEGFGLTKRQAESALIAAHGHSNREIAEQLNLSVRTVESHLYQVFGKLRLRKRSELIRLFLDKERALDTDDTGHSG